MQKSDWGGALRTARQRLRLSRAELAALAGVSMETVKAYETGARPATRANLERLLNALQLERVQANGIREAAGFAPVRSLFTAYPDYEYTIEELQSVVEQVPWPEFVLNDAVEVVAANRVAGAVWGIDFQRERGRRSPVEMNLLAVANERDFPERVENWEEVLALLAAVVKGQFIRPDTAPPSSPYLNEVFSHFVSTGHSFLARFLDIWNAAQPLPPRVRWSYDVVWRDAEFGRMRYHCLVSTASERDGLAFNDWYPVDPGSFEVLERVKARAAAR